MAKNKQNELTAGSLKQTLWETLRDLKAKRIDPTLANAVASQSREIMRIVNAEIRLAELTGGSVRGFLGADPPKVKASKGR